MTKAPRQRLRRTGLATPAYIEMQRQYFDRLADIFLQPIPEPIQERTRQIVRTAGLGRRSRVLDVGTGVGALIKHIEEAGIPQGNIVGCDLSEEMLKRARMRFPGVFFWQGDVAALNKPLPSHFPNHLSSFNAVFFNGCFGNMWNQEEALYSAVNLLAEGGRIVISHPMGSGFVDKLHRSEPHIVPHQLPTTAKLKRWCQLFDLRMSHFEDKEELYLVVLKRKDEPPLNHCTNRTH